ncbi:uncharacterized protein G2W53_006811 [Senna tora]|uniref:Uncharacterized protein n=1 Tax=Senna tora TaxID=362788 RepID=A0A834X5B2_9FABA|nr:uncharacterized protein G2W53_006811 [Senna tora]
MEPPRGREGEVLGIAMGGEGRKYRIQIVNYMDGEKKSSRIGWDAILRGEEKVKEKEQYIWGYLGRRF